ncbi:MAG: hypothetical protein KKH72_02640 [Alphaproteobacteria bacterium]|nr:hypothetical protein [Alphaproteobacteria bacterium]
MITPSSAARPTGFGHSIAVLLLLLAGALPSSALAETGSDDRVDACRSYKDYVAIAGEGSGPARAFGRVCERIGPVAITQSCLVYYTRITDSQFPPDADFKAQLTAECEASMPGGTTLIKASGGDAAEPEQNAATARMYGPPMPCVGGHECALQSDRTKTEDTAKPDDAAPADAPRTEPETSPVVATESPQPDAAAPDTGETQTAATAAAEQAVPEETDRAVELAFWQAAVDSGDKALFEAYLDRFPDGVFVPIARARIAALAAPMPEPNVQPAHQEEVSPQTPEALYASAQAILDAAYQLEVPARDGEIRRALPMLETAGAGGYGPAFVELGGLAENGLGMPPDRDQALAYYRQAGEAGALEGTYRALMLYDLAGDETGYVETFLMLYRADPGMALDSLGDVGTAGPKALQRHLRGTGHYRGPLDGDFGAASRQALAAFASGAPPAPDAAVASAPPPRDLPADGLAVELQQALTRVGCYGEAVDGRWGPSSADALAAFNRWRGSRFATGQPSVEALSAVQRAPGLACPGY